MKFDASYKQMKRPNNLFWEDKFTACLEECGDDGMLVIHADCKCEDWVKLIERCLKVSLSVEKIGVWAPQIDGTYFSLNVSGIIKIGNTGLVFSALTDGIIFYISPEIVKIMRRIKYGKNIFGWGIDLLFCANAHINDKLVVIDTNVRVFHPISTRGYDGKLAKQLENQFLAQLTLRERVECKLLTSYVHYNHAKQ